MLCMRPQKHFEHAFYFCHRFLIYFCFFASLPFFSFYLVHSDCDDVICNNVLFGWNSQDSLQCMLRKENLNGDFFQQFKKYQQKEQPLSSLSIQHKKTTKTHGVENPGPGFGQAYICGGVKLVKWHSNPLLIIDDTWSRYIIHEAFIKESLMIPKG